MWSRNENKKIRLQNRARVSRAHFPWDREEQIMGVFRYENRFAAPTREQRERYMRGEVEEHHFGPEGKITLLLYPEAAYLKDDSDGLRILFTGIRDKPQSVEEAVRLVEYHETKEKAANSFKTGDHTLSEP